MLVAKGSYVGDLVSWRTGGSPVKKTPFFYLTFAVEGTKRTVNLCLSGKAYEYSAMKLRALGFNGNFKSPVFMNAHGVGLLCKHTTGEGGITYEEWDLLDWGDKPAPSPEDGFTSDELDLFNAKWRDKFGAMPEPVGQPVPTVPAPESSEGHCWKLLCLAKNDTAGTNPETERLWVRTLSKMFPNKDNNMLTPKDWGAVMLEIESLNDKEIPF